MKGLPCQSAEDSRLRPKITAHQFDPVARSLRTQQRIPASIPGSELQPMFHPEQPPSNMQSPELVTITCRQWHSLTPHEETYECSLERR
ncbi:hypothetical protein Kisp02_73380 [Kineosporia sp. NBRC 101731]|nr:hypothetical protein Kisp02_73380 [Kineosporia sp. NBRC 101731]